MKTISMQGQLVEVARRFTALPGDLLVIVNGVCLGPQEKPVRSNGAATSPTPVVGDILAVLPKGEEKKAITIGDDLRIDRKDVATRNLLSRLLAQMVTEKQIEKTPNSGRYASYRRTEP